MSLLEKANKENKNGKKNLFRIKRIEPDSRG